jgi:acyl-CoA synthetase (AMP-forming)/AMP-acid ligase II
VNRDSHDKGSAPTERVEKTIDTSCPAFLKYGSKSVEQRGIAMKYDDRPWLKHYEERLPPDISVPDVTSVDLMEASFADFGDRPSFHFMGASKTFADLDADSLRFANFLAEIGCGPGDVVGISLPNIPQYMIAHAGALRAGCAATGVSPLLSAKEVAHQLNDCRARVMVTLDALFEQRFLKLHEKVPNVSHVVVANVAEFFPGLKRVLGKLLRKVPTGKIVPVPGKTVVPFPEVLRKYPAKPTRAAVKPEDTCLIQYTGGTTGLPKGTELTHRNLVTNMHQYMSWLGADVERGKETYCSGFPFFHLAGLGVCMASMALGFTQILIPDPRNTKHICEEIGRYRPTLMTNVPSLYQMLLETPEMKSLDFSCVKTCISGAAPFSVEVIQAFEAVVGEGKVLELYGMTEASPILTMNPHRGRKKIGSVGVPIQSTWLRIMDLEDGTREVPFGEEGEIIAHGPQIMKGYYNQPDETAHALRDLEGRRWFYSGDIGKMDDDGYLYVVDRAKDMLIVGGYKVFSREAEETLYEHPAVEYCAYVGIPNPERPDSHRVKAVIQLSSPYKGKDEQELEKEIVAFCRENMAPYKVPKIVQFVEEIPLTSVGKVDKKALR